MSDLISRADAIEAVAQQWLFEASVGNPYVNDDDIGEYRKLAEELFEDVPSAEADGEDLIIKGAKGIQDGLYNIKDGKLFKYKAKGGTVRTYPIVPSADAVQGEWLNGWEVIRELSETRCMYNCFDENDRPMYEAMTSAIDIVRQMMGGARMKGGAE